MRVLLVYPEYPETFWSFKYALSFISRKASFPPLGLLTVASMMPREWEVKLVDMNVDRLNEKDILWADFVFISAMSVQRESTEKVIDLCKKLEAKIVAGGPLFTSSHQDLPAVDHLVLNEGEITLPQFLEELEKGEPATLYTTDKWADIDKTPTPRWELIDVQKYANMCIQFSRGCPFDCEFCDITALFGRNIRTKSGERVKAELEAVYKSGWRGTVFIVDDNFIGNKKKTRDEILPAIGQWMEENDFPFSFITQASVNLADDRELMENMVKSGFDSVFVGIETPNEESLAECGKLQNRNRDLYACVRDMQQAGLQVTAGFIVGFDHDPPSIFERMIKFIQKSGIVTAMVGLLNAPPGTKLYKRLMEEKRLIEEFNGDNTDFSINFIPKMDYEALIKGYKKILQSIYSPKNYYERVKTLLSNINPLKKKKFQLQPCHVRAFFKSIWLLGIKGKERFYYWKLVFWSLFNRPKLFPLAIMFSIYGFHFRKIFEL